MTTGIGIIGMGGVSGAHVAGIAAAEGAELTAICDVVPACLERDDVAAGVSRYGDPRELLADDAVDAVLILLPHEDHFPVAADAIRAGKHVLLEKPMTVDADQAHELTRLAESSGLTLAVAHNSRFVRAYEEAAALVPGLGDIRLVRGLIHGSALANFARADAGWRIEPNGVDALVDAAPHMFYLLTWMLGGITGLRATERHWVRDNLLPEVRIADSCLVDGRLGGGGAFTIEVSLSAELPWGERLEIYGSEGSVIIDQLAADPVVTYSSGLDRGVPVTAVEHDLFGWQEASIAACAKDFAEAVAARRPPTVDPADAVRAIELLDAARESIASGGIAVQTGNAEGAPS